MPEKDKNAMDFRIGQRIRSARIDASVTQHQLGEILGRSSQQIHKYEQGSNRVSAGTLYAIAEALGHPVDWFFMDERTIIDDRSQKQWLH